MGQGCSQSPEAGSVFSCLHFLLSPHPSPRRSSFSLCLPLLGVPCRRYECLRGSGPKKKGFPFPLSKPPLLSAHSLSQELLFPWMAETAVLLKAPAK